jgi:hypothetical protein
MESPTAPPGSVTMHLNWSGAWIESALVKDYIFSVTAPQMRPGPRVEREGFLL